MSKEWFTHEEKLYVKGYSFFLSLKRAERIFLSKNLNLTRQIYV